MKTDGDSYGVIGFFIPIPLSISKINKAYGKEISSSD
jgi:hypothetical protein